MLTPWAIVRLKFRDNSSEPFDDAFFRDLFTSGGASGQNLFRYFRDISHGTIDWAGTRVFGWHTLNHDRSEYDTLLRERGLGARNVLMDWVREAAVAQGVNSDFYGIVACFNVQTDLFGTPGMAVTDNLSLVPAVLGQEIGHGYGLSHAREDGSAEDYRDPWDIMSANNSFQASNARFQWVGPILNAWNMRAQNWLDENRVWKPSIDAFETTLDLRPLVRKDLPGWLCAELPGGYLVELRVPEDWDAAIRPPIPTVLVHRFEGNHSYIMRNSLGSHNLGVGDTFQSGDPSGSLEQAYVRLDVVSADAATRTARIRIRFQPAHRPNLGVFYRGLDDALVWRAYEAGQWNGEEIFNDQHPYPTRLGGSEAAPATLHQWAGTRFAVFFRGSDGRLRWKAHQGGRWHNDAEVPGGGELTSNPHVVRYGTDDVGVFYRGSDDALVWRAYEAGQWNGEERFDPTHPVPTRMGSAPSVIAGWAGTRFAVFFRGSDGRLRWKAHQGGRWHNDAEVPGGGDLTSNPHVVRYGTDDVGVFYRGSDDALVWRAYEAGQWNGEERFDPTHPVPTRMGSAPSVIAGWAGTRFAVFFRGSDGRLRWKAHQGGRWHNDAEVPGGGELTSNPDSTPYGTAG